MAEAWLKFRQNFKQIFFTRLDRYFYSELLPNYAFGLMFFTFLIMLNELFYMAKYYFEYSLPFSQVLLLLINLIPFLLSFSIPFAVLPAYLLTVGRLSQDSEIVAMKSCGIPIQRVILPGLIFAIFISFFAFYFKDKVEVQSTFNYLRLKAKLMAQKPAVELKEQSNLKIGNYKISFEKIESRKDYDILYNIYVVDISGRKTIKAKTGRVFSNPSNPEHYILKFQNGTITEVLEFSDDQGIKAEHFFIASFKYLALNTYINLPEEFYNKTPETMNMKELKGEIQKLTFTAAKDIKSYKENIKQINKNTINYKKKFNTEISKLSKELKLKKRKELLTFLKKQSTQIKAIKTQIANKEQALPIKHILKYHEKYSMPVSALLFALISLSLGMFSARSGRGEGLGISFLIMIIFYGSKVGIDNLIFKRTLPVFAEWLPNLIILITSVVLFIKKAKE